VSAEPRPVCANCGESIPADSRFCLVCGHRIDSQGEGNSDLKASRTAELPVRGASVEPRIFGVIPPLLALLLGLAGVVLGAILLVTGRWPVGIAAFAIGAVLGALAIDAARRWPTSALPRAVVKVVDRLSAGAGLARVSAGAFSGASREVTQLRRELRRMRRQRDEEQHALGAAALEENDEETAALKERIRERDRRIEEAERRIVEVRDAARDRVARERAAIRPTQPFAVAEDAPEANAKSAEPVTTPTEVKPEASRR
jgi:zinc-ribbon domain